MFRKTLFILIVPLVIGFIISQSVNASSGNPGSRTEPVITKSYADKVLKPLEDRLAVLQEEAEGLKKIIDSHNKPMFSDVPVDHWAYEHVRFMAAKGIISGMGDGTFGTEKYARRSELAVMLVKALELPVSEAQAEFKDVPETHWAYKYIAAAQNAGIISGFPGGIFKPNEYVTRGQMAVMLSRAYSLENTGKASMFKDVPEGYWAYEHIMKLADNKITKGYEDNTFRPAAPVRRAEVAVFLAKAMDPSLRK